MMFLLDAYGALLRLGFRLLYNEMAWSYDWVSWVVSLGQWRRWGQSSIPHLSGHRVLELAFGTGDILLDLHAAGMDVFGLDLSPYMTGITRRKLRKAKIEVPLARGAAQALPFTDDSFDSILLTFPPPFVYERQVLDELARILRPNGRLVIVGRGTLHHSCLSGFIEWLYLITGQRSQPEPSLTERLRELDWNVRELEQRLDKSTVYFLIAELPVASFS